ncbi:zinc finger protein OZF-like [Leguminivora glycinivorella]|uniref:zinc finger protein OZF-like n=1 Tax=Leguminivora glycinivorella TaxID=1035111 RepID=UPI00200CF494|nr:zinc finger protein OZF-like [Leguminivora glycinivorella]
MKMSNSCRCCLLRPPEKNLRTPYTRSDKTEIYSNMLKECFEINLTYLPSDDECGICEVCVRRLRDASDFKVQVQRSQEVLQAWLRRQCHVKEEEDLPKVEKSTNDVDEELVHFEIPIKIEISDPLPTQEEDFKLFMTDLENQTLDECKQEPLEMPVRVIEQSPHATSVKSCIDEFGPGVKPKKERKYRIRKNKNKIYNCDTCGKKFGREVGLNIHKKCHIRQELVCEICKKQFKIKSRLDEHKKTHAGEKPFWCKKCNTFFSDKFNFNKHKRTHRRDKPFACDICKARYTIKENLVSHMSSHSDFGHFRCKLCPVKFPTHKSLRAHIRETHITQTYTCDVCQRVFYYKAELIQHLNTHFKWTIYACDICGLTLATKSSLRRHTMVHTGEKSYACKICNKQFRYTHTLKTHMRTHTGERPHCCEVCGKKFAEMTNLKKHLEIHVEGKVYSCELCTKSYSTSEGLRQHRRTHTKNKLQVKPKVKKEKKNTSFLS